ncbi:hypothetical protein FRC03_002929, partial [Tulasnella sp. 419]
MVVFRGDGSAYKEPVLGAPQTVKRTMLHSFRHLVPKQANPNRLDLNHLPSTTASTVVRLLISLSPS